MPARFWLSVACRTGLQSARIVRLCPHSAIIVNSDAHVFSALLSGFLQHLPKLKLARWSPGELERSLYEGQHHDDEISDILNIKARGGTKDCSVVSLSAMWNGQSVIPRQLTEQRFSIVAKLQCSHGLECSGHDSE